MVFKAGQSISFTAGRACGASLFMQWIVNHAFSPLLNKQKRFRILFSPSPSLTFSLCSSYFIPLLVCPQQTLRRALVDCPSESLKGITTVLGEINSSWIPKRSTPQDKECNMGISLQSTLCGNCRRRLWWVVKRISRAFSRNLSLLKPTQGNWKLPSWIGTGD